MHLVFIPLDIADPEWALREGLCMVSKSQGIATIEVVQDRMVSYIKQYTSEIGYEYHTYMDNYTLIYPHSDSSVRELITEIFPDERKMFIELFVIINKQ